MMQATGASRHSERAAWALLIAVLVLVVAAYGISLIRNGAPAAGFKLHSAAPQNSLQPLADYGPVPAFSLIERGGGAVTNQDLAGRVWVVDFIFTRCAGNCPLMTSRMASLAKSFAREGAVRFLSVSVDPQRDTLQALSSYADRTGADRERWLFVRGEQERVSALASEGFRLGVENGAGGEAEPILHSNRFALVDRSSRIRGYYDGTDAGALDRLTQDIRRLL